MSIEHAYSEARGSRSKFCMLHARGNVDIRFLEPEVPHSDRGTIVDSHTAKQKSKVCPGVTPWISRFRGVKATAGEGRE